jgi:pyruvate kinase
MSPLESLASSAVRTAHKVHASLIVVLTRGGSTARLVAKYRPLVPVLTVAVPVGGSPALSGLFGGARAPGLPSPWCRLSGLGRWDVAVLNGVASCHSPPTPNSLPL